MIDVYTDFMIVGEILVIAQFLQYKNYFFAVVGLIMAIITLLNSREMHKVIVK